MGCRNLTPPKCIVYCTAYLLNLDESCVFSYKTSELLYKMEKRIHIEAFSVVLYNSQDLTVDCSVFPITYFPFDFVKQEYKLEISIMVA
jgi:hypothetical protein